MHDTWWMMQVLSTDFTRRCYRHGDAGHKPASFTWRPIMSLFRVVPFLQKRLSPWKTFIWFIWSPSTENLCKYWTILYIACFDDIFICGTHELLLQLSICFSAGGLVLGCWFGGSGAFFELCVLFVFGKAILPTGAYGSCEHFRCLVNKGLAAKLQLKYCFLRLPS